jgi:hypothetical protein
MMKPQRLGEFGYLASDRAVLSNEAHEQVVRRKTQSILSIGHGFPLFCRSSPRSSSSSSTSRSDNEYRRYQRTAHRMRAGSVCRHLKIAGRVAIADCIQPTTMCLSQVATQPPGSPIMITRSRELSLKLVYQLTHKMMICRSKCRPLNRPSIGTNCCISSSSPATYAFAPEPALPPAGECIFNHYRTATQPGQPGPGWSINGVIFSFFTARSHSHSRRWRIGSSRGPPRPPYAFACHQSKVERLE